MFAQLKLTGFPSRIFSGLNSSRRNLQSSLSGSVHGISSGSLRIPPAPPAPTTLPPPDLHVCIAGGMIDRDLHDLNDDMGYDDDDNMESDECQIHLNDDMMDAELNNEPFISITSTMNTANSNVNHYMNISSAINPNGATNDYYQNVMQLQNGESV